MLEPQEVLLDNLIEALRQVQRYVSVGLWTGIYPGFPTSPSALVRYAAAALPALFALAAVLLRAFRASDMDGFTVWMACVFVAAPYVTLGLELRRPIGRVEAAAAPSPPDVSGAAEQAAARGAEK